MNSHTFTYGLRHWLHIRASGEKGEVIGQAAYANGEDQYLLRYKAGDGRATEQWWGESALRDDDVDNGEADL